MKTHIHYVILSLLLLTSSFVPLKNASAQGGYVDFQVFYDELSPYGTWVDNPDYGYVWIPDVAAGFTPYSTNGYWVFTDEGWTWVSNYPWGWAPFHYGRWFTDPFYGPIWVPDNQWGPGWVTWRRSVNYYGWAAIGPGVSISVAYGSSYYDPYNQYTFVSGFYMGRTTINNYYIHSSNNRRIINNSVVINNIRVNHSRQVSYNAGPERVEIEKRAGQRIHPINIRENSRPGQAINKNELQIYRPRVQKHVSGTQTPVPGRVENLNRVKPAAQRQEAPRQKVTQPARQQKSQPAHQATPAVRQPKAQPQRQQQPQKQQPQAQPQRQQQPQNA